jgi:hypothetical protein
MILFKELRLGDCEDPQLYAAVPIMEWEKSEEGNWVMNHATDIPEWRITTDPTSYGFKVQIWGSLKEADEIIYRLKFGFQK